MMLAIKPVWNKWTDPGTLQQQQQQQPIFKIPDVKAVDGSVSSPGLQSGSQPTTNVEKDTTEEETTEEDEEEDEEEEEEEEEKEKVRKEHFLAADGSVDLPRAYVFMRDMLRELLTTKLDERFGADPLNLFAVLPMKLSVLSHIPGALIDSNVFVKELHSCRNIGSIDSTTEKWRVVKALRRAAKAQAYRYSATNRVILTFHGRHAKYLLYAGEGQAFKAGGNKIDNAILTPVCGASTTLDCQQRLKFSRYLCWRSLVGLVDQFLDGKKKALKHDLSSINTLYKQYMKDLAIEQRYTTTVFLDNAVALAASIRYPHMADTTAAAVPSLEASLGQDAQNVPGMVLRRFVLLGFSLWRGPSPFKAKEKSDIIYLHILAECGVFLLCHKFGIPYVPNTRTLPLMNRYLEEEERTEDIKKGTTLMYNALGAASQSIALLENRSAIYIEEMERLLTPQIGGNPAFIVNSYLPTFQ